MELKDLSVIAGIILGNMVGVGAIARYMVNSVIRSNETLPVIAESVKTMTESIKELKTQNDELYNSRNDLDKRVTSIETIHDVNGCNLPPPQRYHAHRRHSDGLEP